MEENKKQIFVEKHKWPDEVKEEKRKRKNRIFIVLAIVLAFGVGYFIPRGNSSILPTSSPKMNASDSEKFNTIKKVLEEKWYFGAEISKEQDLNEYIMDHAIRGMSNENDLDQHTQYLDKKDASVLATSLSGSLVGIGIQYYPVGDEIMIEKVFMNAPAHKAGLKEGDIIKKVDGVSISGKKTEDIRKMILGDEGTKVSIEVLRGSEKKTFEIARAVVSLTVYGYVEGGDTGVLEISSFSENTAKEVETYLKSFKDQGIKQLIIDVRGNGGGYVKTATDISGLLVGANKVVANQVDKEGNETTYNTPSRVNQYEFEKTAILIDGNTASASEMLTGALKEYINTEIIGVKSYGKGTAQDSISFDDGSIFKYTIAEWTRPKKEKVNKVGIKPDREVKLDEAITYQPNTKDKNTYETNQVGKLVKDTQVYLKFLGYDVDRVDGYYSEKTKEAVLLYQQENGVEANGIISQELVNIIVSSTSRKWHDEKEKLDTQKLKALEVVRE